MVNINETVVVHFEPTEASRDEIEQRETTSPDTFTAGCKLCKYETVYSISDGRPFDSRRARSAKITTRTAGRPSRS